MDIRDNVNHSDPTIAGVLEAALYVEDLDFSTRFYRELFGFEQEIYNEFISVLRVAPAQVFILFPHAVASQPERTSSPAGIVNGTIPAHGVTGGRMHIAFAISEPEKAFWKQRLAERNIVIEGEVAWNRGGCSLYFRDPDDHLVELVTPGLWSNY